MIDKYNINTRRDAEVNIENFVKGGKNEDAQACCYEHQSFTVALLLFSFAS